MKKSVLIGVIFLLCFSVNAQKDKGYTQNYSAYFGSSFLGQENYTSISLTSDIMLPFFHDYKYRGYGLFFSQYNKDNLFIGPMYFFKPIPCCIMRNPYFFHYISLNGGYLKNKGESGLFVRPELFLMMNTTVYQNINLRFRFSVSYDLSSIQDFSAAQPGIHLQLGIGFNQRKNFPED